MGLVHIQACYLPQLHSQTEDSVQLWGVYSTVVQYTAAQLYNSTAAGSLLITHGRTDEHTELWSPYRHTVVTLITQTPIQHQLEAGPAQSPVSQTEIQNIKRNNLPFYTALAVTSVLASGSDCLTSIEHGCEQTRYLQNLWHNVPLVLVMSAAHTHQFYTCFAVSPDN